MDAPAATTDPGLSRDQLKQALWADKDVNVYAVVMGDRVPDLQARLGASAVDDWDRLWTGELDPVELRAAPVLLALRPDTEFGDWLIGNAAADLGPWGLLMLSPRPFLAARQQGRDLCLAALPDGQEIRIDWMDPELALAVLSGAAPPQLERFFGDVRALVLPHAAGWTWLHLSAGRLEQRSMRLLNVPG